MGIPAAVADAPPKSATETATETAPNLDAEVVRIGDLTRVHALAPADFDGDGSLEVAALGRRNGQDGRLQIFATQPPHDLLFEAEVGESATGLATGDFNEDGNLDLAVSLHSEARFVVLLQLQSRDLIDFERRDIEVTYRPEGTGNPHTHSVRAVDVNHDGHLDLLTAQAEWNAVLAMLGDGTGRFDETVPLARTGEHPYDVIIATDAGGRRYLLTPNAQGSGLTLAAVPPAGAGPALGSEHSVRREQALDAESPRGISTVACGHLDGDDQLDLVVGGYEAHSLAVYYNTLSEAAESKHDRLHLDQLGDHELLKAPASFTAPRIADLNGDGRNEVISACMSRRSIFVWLRVAGRDFGPPHKFGPAQELECGGLDVQVVEARSTSEGIILFAGGWNEPGIAILRLGGAATDERSPASDRRKR